MSEHTNKLVTDRVGCPVYTVFPLVSQVPFVSQVERVATRNMTQSGNGCIIYKQLTSLLLN